MKFEITRTSTWNEKPCEEAVLEDCIRVDERTTSKPENIPAHKGQSPDWWYAQGFNHRVENRHIKRDFKDRAFFVEINSLEELMNFQKKYGDLILRAAFMDKTKPGIEIYDDYRE